MRRPRIHRAAAAVGAIGLTAASLLGCQQGSQEWSGANYHLELREHQYPYPGYAGFYRYYAPRTIFPQHLRQRFFTHRRYMD